MSQCPSCTQQSKIAFLGLTQVATTTEADDHEHGVEGDDQNNSQHKRQDEHDQVQADPERSEGTENGREQTEALIAFAAHFPCQFDHALADRKRGIVFIIGPGTALLVTEALVRAALTVATAFTFAAFTAAVILRLSCLISCQYSSTSCYRNKHDCRVHLSRSFIDSSQVEAVNTQVVITGRTLISSRDLLLARIT
jgi:hypothetical protein